MESHGVTLEQYAGTLAAEREGLHRDEALAQECIDPAAFRQADLEFKKGLAADQALFERFTQHFGAAQDCLARRAPPLDDDLGAWTAFLVAVKADPGALSRANLGPNDLARLERRWARRLAADQKLADEAARRLARTEAELPAVRPEPPRLRPFPWTPSALRGTGAGAAAAAPAEEVLRPDSDVDVFAALSVALEELPEERASLFADVGLTEDGFAAVAAAWRTRFARDPALRAEFQLISGEHRLALRGMLRPRDVMARPVEREMELWAALVAGLEALPDEREGLLADCGVGPEELPAVESRWRALLAADPAARAEYAELLEAHRAAVRRMMSSG